MKLSVLLLMLPLVMVFAAEKPASKKTAKAPAQSKAPKVVIPPGFGPRVGAAQPQPTPASPAPKPEVKPSGRIMPASNPAPAITIPKGAEEISPNVFRHTDAQGITWNYSKTPFGVSKTREDEAAKKVSAVNSNKSPFGVSRVEKKAAATAPPAESGMEVTVKDLGDRLQFERATPFGTTTWQRNKSELTDAERAMWEREQKKAASTADRAESRP